jgi:hypothetical protein
VRRRGGRGGRVLGSRPGLASSSRNLRAGRAGAPRRQGGWCASLTGVSACATAPGRTRSRRVHAARRTWGSVAQAPTHAGSDSGARMARSSRPRLAPEGSDPNVGSRHRSGAVTGAGRVRITIGAGSRASGAGIARSSRPRSTPSRPNGATPAWARDLSWQDAANVIELRRTGCATRAVVRCGVGARRFRLGAWRDAQRCEAVGRIVEGQRTWLSSWSAEAAWCGGWGPP